MSDEDRDYEEQFEQTMTSPLPLALNQNGQPASITEQILAAGGAIQRVGTAYATAMVVQKPRDIAVIQTNFLAEARLAGESFFYGWGSGKNRIEGASVGLAMALLRTWGNCAVEHGPIQDLADAWVYTARFIDLETGVTVTRPFRQDKKFTVYGKHDEFRKTDMRFAIGASKATRNVILSVLPDYLIDAGIATAKAGAGAKLDAFLKSMKEKGKDGLQIAIGMVVGGLIKAGVKEDAILRRFEVETRAALTRDNVLTMRGDLSTIDKGNEEAATLYPANGNGNGGKQDHLEADLKKKAEEAKAQEGKAEPPKAEPPQAGPQPPAAPPAESAKLKRSRKKPEPTPAAAAAAPAAPAAAPAPAPAPQPPAAAAPAAPPPAAPPERLARVTEQDIKHIKQRFAELGYSAADIKIKLEEYSCERIEDLLEGQGPILIGELHKEKAR
jgi:hypothetical protein